MLGTKQPAEDGKLIVLASGPAEALERARPAFDAVAAKVAELGEAGAGSRMKVVVNSWILTLTAGLAETLALAEVLDVEGRDFLELIAGGPLDAAYAQMKGEAMLAGEYPTSFPLRLAAQGRGPRARGGSGERARGRDRCRRRAPVRRGAGARPRRRRHGGRVRGRQPGSARAVWVGARVGAYSRAVPEPEPLNVADYERLAARAAEPGVHGYFAGGAGDERTLRDNVAAFARRRLRPRVLVDVGSVSTATTVLGTEVSMPLLVAPVGVAARSSTPTGRWRWPGRRPRPGRS